MPNIDLSPKAKIELQQCLTGYLVNLYRADQPQPADFAVTSELLSRIRSRSRAGRFNVSDQEWGILIQSGYTGRTLEQIAEEQFES